MSVVHDPNAGVITTPALDTEEGVGVSDYTPTTEEILRAYRLPRTVEPQQADESFADYLSRLSIGSMHDQIESEVAAHRWLALHDAEVAAAAVYEQKPGAWEWDPAHIARYEQGMAAAEDYATGIEPSRRAETIDDFMTGWCMASETPRPSAHRTESSSERS